MAQLVERVLGKDEVAGSNPASSSRKEVDLVQLLFSFTNLRTVDQGCHKDARQARYSVTIKKKLQQASSQRN